MLPMVLHGKNYNKCAQSVLNALKANNTLRFIDGAIQTPKSTESTMYTSWIQVNSKLEAWIHNTLDAAVCSSLFLKLIM